VGAPIYLTNDGYVLKVVKENSFYPLTAEKITALQKEGDLPTPLPPYTIPTGDYVMGYILWVVAAVVVAFALLKRWLARRRQETDELVPVSMMPPTVEKKGDRFIVEQISPHLGSGETVTHMGYALSQEMSSGWSAVGAKAFHVALTNKRLFIVEARVGAFGPLFENKGLTVLERSSIVGATRDDRTIHVQCADGRSVTLWIVPKQKHFSNQATLLRDLPRVLQPGGAMSPMGATAGYIRPA
jgi:hypothetical protein